MASLSAMLNYLFFHMHRFSRTPTATGFATVFLTCREEEKRITAPRGPYKEESDIGKRRRNGKGGKKRLWGDYKVMVTAWNFHAVSWSRHGERSGLLYFFGFVCEISCCDTPSCVFVNRCFRGTVPALRDNGPMQKDVRRLCLSGSSHAWISTWDRTPRRDNYGARKRSDNQGRDAGTEAKNREKARRWNYLI